MGNFKYRPDIDGLRALAVLFVLFFHFDLGVEGGFIGVDIFFVISGYLITGIILNAQENDNFCLKDFWIRRLRRILPASTFVVITTLLAGFFLLIPDDYVKLAQSVKWQQLMLANVYFWRNANYFDGAAELKPLLHTWSLSVEEQFYLFLPFFLVFTKKTRKVALYIFKTVFVISFLLSMWGVRHSQMATFYLLPTRCWELLLGALLAFRHTQTYLKSRNKCEILSVVGLISILYTTFFYTTSTLFPAEGALFPCLGAALLIEANRYQQTKLGKFLSYKPLVFIGLISYSLYLWHWPIIAYSNYWFGTEFSLPFKLVSLALCSILATLTWKYVETPFRTKKGFDSAKSMTFAPAITSLLGILLCTSVIEHNNGFPGRLPESLNTIVSLNSSKKAPYNHLIKPEEKKPYSIGRTDLPDNPISFFLWGDSHGLAIAKMLDRVAGELDIRGQYAISLATTPLLDTWKYSGEYPKNLRWNSAVCDYIIDNKIPCVILVSRWSHSFSGMTSYKHKEISEKPEAALELGLRTTFNKLSSAKTKVIFVKQVPEQPYDRPDLILLRSKLFGSDIPPTITLEEYQDSQAIVNKILDKVLTDFPEVTVIDPSQHCFDENKDLIFSNSEATYYRDDDHLLADGAMYFFGDVFKTLLGEIELQGNTDPSTENNP